MTGQLDRGSEKDHGRDGDEHQLCRTRSSAARPTGPQFGLPPGRPRSPFCPMSIRKRLVKIGARMINARVETVHEKPAFRRAFTRRRCLLPADGFYEWEQTKDTATGKARKQPYFIHPEDDQVVTPPPRERGGFSLSRCGLATDQPGP